MVADAPKSICLGTVESSIFIATYRGGTTMPSHIGYFTDKSVGGNQFTIGFGHSMEFIIEGMLHLPLFDTAQQDLFPSHRRAFPLFPPTSPSTPIRKQ